MNWRVGTRRQVDLAVLDRQSGEPIALFELKSERNPINMRMAQEQLVGMSAELKDQTVPMYAVFPEEDGAAFELHRVLAGGGQEPQALSLAQVPEFRLLQSTMRLNAAAKAKEERRKSVDHLTWVSWLLALIVATVTVLDIMDIIDLTTERFGMIVLVAGLVVLPFASKLKVLGLEFERFKREDMSD